MSHYQPGVQSSLFAFVVARSGVAVNRPINHISARLRGDIRETVKMANFSVSLHTTKRKKRIELVTVNVT